MQHMPVEQNVLRVRQRPDRRLHQCPQRTRRLLLRLAQPAVRHLRRYTTQRNTNYNNNVGFWSDYYILHLQLMISNPAIIFNNSHMVHNEWYDSIPHDIRLFQLALSHTVQYCTVHHSYEQYCTSANEDETSNSSYHKSAAMGIRRTEFSSSSKDTVLVWWRDECSYSCSSTSSNTNVHVH